MKDKDFDEIGKRLYELEADPPKDGWKRIGAGLTVVPPMGKRAFLRKNWWKPLVVIAPLSIWLMLHQSETTNEKSIAKTDTAGVSSAEKMLNEGKDDKAGIGEVQKEETASYNESLTDQTSISDNDSQAIKKARPIDGKRNDSVDGQSIAAKKHPQRNGVRVENSNNTSKNTILTESLAKTETSDGPLALTHDTSAGNFPKGSGAEAIPAQSLDQSPANQSAPTIHENSSEQAFTDGQDKKANTISTTTTQMSTIDTPEDSAAHKSLMKLADVDSARESEVEEKITPVPSWRIDFVVAPQYVTKKVNPLPNDEVLMIDMTSKKPFYHEQIGIGISIGAGKAISENWYVDALVNYQRAEQTISYSYSDGKVDTLIATARQDGSVIVNPVYDLHESQVSTTYSYGGLRIATTYYFWKRTHTRFNLTVGAGAHYLLSAKSREKLDGNWIDISDNDDNKTNYSFMASAGYNVTFGRNWELQIGPVLNYFLRKDKNPQLPFAISQRAYGVNIMLSKRIGR